MKRLPIASLLLLAGCPKNLPDDQACVEVGYAIAARVEQCTGDADLGESLYDRFEAETTCRLPVKDEASIVYEQPVLAFECAFVTRNLACELAVEYGDDLSLWLGSSPICRAILEGP